jgi:aromatase
MDASQLTLEGFTEIVSRCSGVPVSPELLRDQPDATFGDLGVDSLGVLGVIAECEHLGVRLGEDAECCSTPIDLYEMVTARLGSQPAGSATPGHTENAIVINAPFDLVWDMTNDVPSWPHLFSEYAAADILVRSGDSVRFRLTMHPDENGTVWSWVSERTVDRERGEVRAHRVETGAFEYMDIQWFYEQVPDGVRMRWTQDFEMKDSAPVDTPTMTDRINHNSLVQMRRIKSLVEQRARELGLVARR